MKTYFKISILSIIALIMTSCTLDLQDEFNFKPDVNDNDPFENLTAWEFIQQRRTNSIADPETGARRLDDNNLDYLRAAIEAAGFESLYMANTTRTFLFLSNRAFINGNNDRNPNVIINGSRGTAPRTVNVDTYFEDLEPEQMNRLKAILLYHIIEGEQLDQLQAFPTINVVRKFNTLLPQVTLDENDAPLELSDSPSEIALERRLEFKLTINPDTADLIPSALDDDFDSRNVAIHNFVLSNGIGHFIEGAVRFQEYNLYNDLEVTIE